MYVESTWHVFCISFLQMMPLTMLGNIVNAAALKKTTTKKTKTLLFSREFYISKDKCRLKSLFIYVNRLDRMSKQFSHLFVDQVFLWRCLCRGQTFIDLSFQAACVHNTVWKIIILLYSLFMYRLLLWDSLREMWIIKKNPHIPWWHY